MWTPVLMSWQSQTRFQFTAWAVAGALIGSISILAGGSLVAASSVSNAVAYCGFGVGVSAILAYIGQLRGLSLLWWGAGATWLLLVGGTLTMEAYALADAETMGLVSRQFAVWSLLAFPIAVATLAGHVRRQVEWSVDRSLVVAGAAIWLGLSVGMGHLGSFAPDVGGSPLRSDLAVLLITAVVVPLPLLISWWFIRWGKKEYEVSR